MFVDGQKVAYVGDGDGRHDVGDVGRVIGAGNTASWVKWVTGVSAGHMAEVGHHEIVAVTNGVDPDALDGPLVTFAVREEHAYRGPHGVIDRLNDEGHLGSFQTIAEEALAHIAARIRTDPSIVEVLAQLDPEDGEELVSTATVALLRDAFGGER
jgi:hypothetical protein